MYDRALKGYEDAIGLENMEIYTPALERMLNRGDLYREKKKLTEAREIYSRALRGFEAVGWSSVERQYLYRKGVLESIDLSLGKI